MSTNRKFVFKKSLRKWKPTSRGLKHFFQGLKSKAPFTTKKHLRELWSPKNWIFKMFVDF